MPTMRSLLDGTIPASIGAGTLSPHFNYLVSADAGCDGGGLGWTKGNDAVQSVSLVNPFSFGPFGDGWPYNGQGAANVSMTADFKSLGSDHDGAKAQVQIISTFFAKCGCCGGCHPGGDAHAEVQWLSDLVLPGRADEQWRITVTIDQRVTGDALGQGMPVPPCTISIENQVYPVNPGSTIDLISGVYSMVFQSSKAGLSNRDRGNTDEAHATLTQTLKIEAKKV
ncbi:MAG TPA: hypothetical protein VMF56_02410 [Acidobacteriaceae bacterium]|nr:hypothetical protein [Acidobacteriaceae bacterium]